MDSSNLEKINILIIEDNEDDLYFIKKALSGERYNLQEIISGTDAYNYLTNPSTKHDIVLLDNHLPGMNGLEILEKLGERKNDFGFIFLTVDSVITTVVKAMRTGALDFIVKSTNLKNELSEKIDKIYEIQKNKIKLKEQTKELIIAKKKAEESEAKFKKLSNLTFEGIIIHDMGIVIDINLSLAKMFGYTCDELIGKNIIKLLIPEKYHKIISENIIKNYALPYDVEGIKKDGSIIPVELEARNIMSDDNNKMIRVAAVRDISLRKKSEKEIEQERLFNEKLIESSPGIFFLYEIINNQAKLIKWNKNHEILLDYTKNELQTMFIEDFILPNQLDKLNRGIEDIIKGLEVDIELNIKHKSGHIIPYFLKCLGFQRNNKQYFLGIGIDISKLKKTEQELIKAKERAEESDQLKTEFIHNMSHEIRTPLNGILGFSKILNKPNLNDAKKEHYINIIQNSGNQLMRIIDDILEISKLGTKQVKSYEKKICLNDLLLELFSIFDIKAKENKTPLYLNKELSDKESMILTDETKLNKILSNLLENALKFTNTGFIEFGYQLKNMELEIYVKDTGIGIKQESQKIIFERFSQEEKSLERNVGGLGLGLSIAKENAELLGGKITVQSEKGKGTTFFVTIPYKPVKSNTENNKADNDSEKTTKKQDKYTILIVEDEEVNYLYIDTLLEDFELNLITLHAKHGKEAVEMCKENTEIDFVLMDMKMPIMTGFEATKLIKEFRQNLPIVAQTAYSTRDEKEQAFSAGCDDFISKPISEETLNGIINKYLIIK